MPCDGLKSVLWNILYFEVVKSGT